MEEAADGPERVHEVCHAMEVVSDAGLVQVGHVGDHAGGGDIGNACVENRGSAAAGGRDVTFATLWCETEIDKRHAAAANTAQPLVPAPVRATPPPYAA